MGIIPFFVQVKEAYRRKCLSFHPDLVEPAARAAAEARFKELSSAYQMITRAANTASTTGRTRGHGFDANNQAWNSWRQQYGHARGSAGVPQGGRFSNGVIAAVIAAPLMLLGYWMQHSSEKAYNRGSTLQQIRPHGLLHPPVSWFSKLELSR